MHSSSRIKSWRIKPFINKCNWEEINFPSEKDDWKKFEKKNVKTALNVLHTKKGKIYLAYVSKHNSNREKQVILLMIPNGEGWEGREHEAKSEGQWYRKIYGKIIIKSCE